MKNELLHVVAAISNPLRWNSRIRLYKKFEEHMLDSGVNLTVVECAYGERPFELNTNTHVNHIPVRAKTIAWNKENLMNIGISRIPEAKYIGCFDADIEFRKTGWATEAVHALQMYDVIQPWSDVYDLGPHDEHINHHVSFCKQYLHGQPLVATEKKFWKTDGGGYSYPHSGYAWCYTRQALEWLGGLFEYGTMGSGDHHMALSLAGRAEWSVPSGISQNYRDLVFQWQSRATHHINQNVGYVQGTIEHGFHGRKSDRGYQSRWDMFIKHGFDPLMDTKKNTYGVIEFAGNKPALQNDFDRYMRSRNEDINSL